MMYEVVSELQRRSEDLDRRILALENKLDSVLAGVQSLPAVLSQAVATQQRDFLDDLACRVHFHLTASLGSELCCSSGPERQQRQLGLITTSAPEAPYVDDARSSPV